jgi:hypothetical protein
MNCARIAVTRSNSGALNASEITPTSRQTHLWTPREMQAVFEKYRHVVGCCHLSGL